MSFKGVILFILIGGFAACNASTPASNTCPRGECCYIGYSDDPMMWSRAGSKRYSTDQTTVTSNLNPCGNRGVSCGGGLCCWEGYVCGPPGTPQ